MCGDGEANTGEPGVCAGMSKDADLSEVFVVSRNDDGGSFGDVGVLTGTEGLFRWIRGANFR